MKRRQIAQLQRDLGGLSDEAVAQDEIDPRLPRQRAHNLGDLDVGEPSVAPACFIHRLA